MGPLYGVTRPRFSYVEAAGIGACVGAYEAIGWVWWGIIPVYVGFAALCLLNDGVFKSKMGGGGNG